MKNGTFFLTSHCVDIMSSLDYGFSDQQDQIFCMCASSFPPLTVSPCVGNGNTTRGDRQVSGNTFFLPPNSPLIMMSPHCTTVTLENSSFFIMQSRHFSIFPEDPRKQSPGSSVSWEWAHSWALREHPGLGGGNVLKWKLKFTSVEHVLISICLSLMTHHSLQTRVYFTFCTYGAQFNTLYFLSCHISMFLLSFPSISALLVHSI